MSSDTADEKVSMVDETVPATSTSMDRVHRVIQLLEDDPLGYRLDRYIAQEREVLAEQLSQELFRPCPPPGRQLQAADLLARTQAYDEILLPFIEFFAVGVAYSTADQGEAWADFLERITTCNVSRDGQYDEHLGKLSFYPAFVLLYAAGVMAAMKKRWSVLPFLFSRRLVNRWDMEKVLVLKCNSVDILPEQAQRMMPDQERAYVPLINHIHSKVRSALTSYFLTEARYDKAFSEFEIILAASYALAHRQEYQARGVEIPTQFWVPAGRYWWSGRGNIDILVAEASVKRANWSPTVAGMFSGDVGLFIELAENIKTLVSNRGGW